MTRRRAAKAFAGHHCDRFGVEQGFGEGLAAQARRAHIQHHIHRPVGRAGAQQGLPGQQIQHQIAATAERGRDPVFQIGPGGQREPPRRLNIARNAIGRVGGQIGGMGDHLGRADQPAKARSGHRMAFRQRPDHQRLRRHPRQRARAQMAAVPDLGVIHLVRNQPQPVALADLRDPVQRGAGIDLARGVVGRVDQERPRALGGGIEDRDLGQEIGFGPGLNPHGHAAGPPDRARIGGIIGVQKQRPVARIEGRDMRGKKCGLSPRRDQHIFRPRRHARARLHPRGDIGAQTLGARHLGIARLARLRGGVHRVQNAGIGAHVMFADGQVRQGQSGRFARAGLVKNAPAIAAAARQPGDPCRCLHALPLGRCPGPTGPWGGGEVNFPQALGPGLILIGPGKPATPLAMTKTICICCCISR